MPGAAASIIFVATKVWLLRQNICRDKHFFVKKHVFVATKHVLSRKIKLKNACRDKNILSRQSHVCFATNIILSRQNTCFLATCTRNTCLSRQKLYLWQLPPMMVNCHLFSLHQNRRGVTLTPSLSRCYSKTTNKRAKCQILKLSFFFLLF